MSTRAARPSETGISRSRQINRGLPKVFGAIGGRQAEMPLAGGCAERGKSAEGGSGVEPVATRQGDAYDAVHGVLRFKFVWKEFFYSNNNILLGLFSQKVWSMYIKKVLS